MISKHDGAMEVQSNADELNKVLRKLYKIEPNIAKEVIKKIAWGIYNDVVRRTPYDTGTARSRWSTPQPFNNGLAYKISNPTHYLIYLEFGVRHGLSSDPEKRKNSLKYLFATGVLSSVGGVIEYHYTPKNTKTGFIRDTLEEWRLKAPYIIKDELTDWMVKESRQLRK